ncbi:hypothetical protein NHF50_09990 [Flavobacterium sp. NRK F10]|uniref:hypothetical protein n=1 Tax=Flavobacterium sp. NRK F10 TaxID=2954931 RepID=UPI002090B913|nr:hypothetical protein [Flavobacterium sp. NRK F10]MCO6175373.1 hypothetical protein [Flavobacterium sp. NRK F10]
MCLNFNENIIAGKSIAGISINDNVKDWVNSINPRQIKQEAISEQYTDYVINNGIVSFTGNNESGLIEKISCKRPYNGKFDNFFYPGMVVNELIVENKYSIILHGILIIDKSMNIGFDLPEEFTELDSIKELPKFLVLEELHVMKNNWWR